MTPTSGPFDVSPRHRVALVTPRFHGLHEAISQGLRELDLEVTTVVYDSRESLGRQILEKLRTDVPERVGRNVLPAVRRRTTALVNSALAEIQYDTLLVIKGDVIDPQLVIDASRRGKRTVAWLYDAIANTHHTTETLSCFDRVASFSPSDAAALAAVGVNARFLPLAADERFMRNPPVPVIGPDVVFFGARYDQREQQLQSLHDQGYAVMAYGRDWSLHPRDRIRSLSWHRPSFPTNTDVPRQQVSKVSGDAVCVLNMHNHNQDGFNLRTFEVPGAAGLQLIDRDDVAEFYEPGAEVLLYRSIGEASELIERAKREAYWAEQIRAAGWRRTRAEHTFAHRMATLLS